MIELIGIYKVDNQKEVHLLEFLLNQETINLEIDDFYQLKSGISDLDLQASWDEKYLDKDGTSVVGDWLTTPDVVIRIAFFYHFLDFNLPMQTPFGEVGLITPTSIPKRLVKIIKYENPD